jgi:hypothetical protein
LKNQNICTSRRIAHLAINQRLAAANHPKIRHDNTRVFAKSGKPKRGDVMSESETTDDMADCAKSLERIASSLEQIANILDNCIQVGTPHGPDNRLSGPLRQN